MRGERPDVRIANAFEVKPMHAVFKQHQPRASGAPIRGTFYPSSDAQERGSAGTMVPKLLAFLVAMAVLRTVVANVKRHVGASRSMKEQSGETNA